MDSTALTFVMSLRRPVCSLLGKIGEYTVELHRPHWFNVEYTSKYIIQDDLTKAARKVGEAKKHECKSYINLSISGETCLTRNPQQN